MDHASAPRDILAGCRGSVQPRHAEARGAFRASQRRARFRRLRESPAIADEASRAPGRLPPRTRTGILESGSTARCATPPPGCESGARVASAVAQPTSLPTPGCRSPVCRYPVPPSPTSPRTGGSARARPRPDRATPRRARRARGAPPAACLLDVRCARLRAPSTTGGPHPGVRPDSVQIFSDPAADAGAEGLCAGVSRILQDAARAHPGDRSLRDAAPQRLTPGPTHEGSRTGKQASPHTPRRRVDPMRIAHSAPRANGPARQSANPHRDARRHRVLPLERDAQGGQRGPNGEGRQGESERAPKRCATPIHRHGGT